MNFEINEMEFFPIQKINQLNKYETYLDKGSKQNEVYKTSILIKLNYFDDELECFDKEIRLPFELNLGDKELIKLELISVDINVIDNHGINVEYNLEVEVSDVDYAFDQENLSFDEVKVSALQDIDNVEEAKENISASYEELMSNTCIREELPLKYIEKEEQIYSNLKDDFMSVKVLFNVNVDDVDKLAFKYNLSIDDCFKKLSSDKTRLII